MKSIIEAEDLPFFKLSDSQDLILFLIQQELRGIKFTGELDRIGFDHSLYSSDPGVIILSLAGFRHRTDDLWNWYHETVDTFAEQVDLHDPGSTRELALDFYLELRSKLKPGSDARQ